MSILVGMKRADSFLSVSTICVKRSDLLISILLHNIRSFDEQYCYCDCLRKMFEVNYLRRKNNKGSAAPLMASIVVKSDIKSCFEMLYLCVVFLLHKEFSYA